MTQNNVIEQRKVIATIKGQAAREWSNAIRTEKGIVSTVFEENKNGVVTHVNIYLED